MPRLCSADLTQIFDRPPNHAIKQGHEFYLYGAWIWSILAPYNAIVKTVQWFGFCGVTVNAKERSVSLVCFVNKLITVSFPLHFLSPLKRQTF